MIRRARHRTRIAILAVATVIMFDVASPVGAATLNATTELTQISSKRAANGRYTVTVRFKVSSLSRNERVSSISVTSGNGSCSAKGTSRYCQIKNLKKGVVLQVKARAKTNRGWGKASSRTRFVVGTTNWSPNKSAPKNGCTINGTAKNDKLTGTAGNDVICGWGGADTISGGGGNDTIYSYGPPAVTTSSLTSFSTAVVRRQSADTAGDVISGGDGADFIVSGNGKDTLTGGAGDDQIYAGEGDDSLAGEAGNDLLLGQNGADSIDGGDGVNRCDRDGNEPVVPSCLYDTQAPQALSMTLSTTSIDTAAAAATITVDVRLTDDLVGPAGNGYTSSPTQVRFTHSSGQYVTAIFQAEDRISGTASDGIYRDTITVPRGAAQGTWTADSFLLVDQVGNMRRLTTQDMTTAGFTTSFING